MGEIPSLKVIARIKSDFPSKFGIPRQSGLVETLSSAIIFEPEFRSVEALRGLDGFSHIWLIWLFSENVRESWSPTVRPPRLGGNRSMGVFATRSPFRPNPIGLSSVKIDHIDFNTGSGPVIFVEGADLMDGTPILDIKPYVPYVDSHPEALEGFAPSPCDTLSVDFPESLLSLLPADKQSAAVGVLSQDPRPRYQDDPDRTYGLEFAGFDIKFKVEGKQLTVTDVVNLK